MSTIVLAGGVLAQAVAWWLVARRRLPFWPATSVTFAILGVAAAFVLPDGCCPFRISALAVGIASGLALFIATRGAVRPLRRIAPFAASVAGAYRRAEETPSVAVWVLTLAIAVPGEEIFWRAFVLPELQDATSVVVGAVLAWVGYVAVNALGGELALLIAAVVCGAAWTILGAYDPLVAPLSSHLLWTALMLAWPPKPRRAKVTA
ncbi:MAG: CPBP family glutamic-type intramembrane protease [Actinomycetota bacterium]